MKRGYKPPSGKGKPKPHITGENNWHWKGDKASYRSTHTWVRKWKCVPIYCEKCGVKKSHPRSIHWANIDHKYRKVLDDYIALCMKCHWEYDRKHNGK